MVCCLCCATGPVAGVLRIDRCGYVPGEAIPFSTTMQNDSDRNINSVKVKLLLVSSCEFVHSKLFRPLQYRSSDIDRNNCLWFCVMVMAF